MTHRYIKIGLTVAVLVGAFSGLLWSTLKEGTEYFKQVDEVMVDPHQWEGKPLQLRTDIVIVSAGGILPTAFLRDLGVMVETKFGTA